MKQKREYLKQHIRKLTTSRFAGIFSALYIMIDFLEYHALSFVWRINAKKQNSEEEKERIADFSRQTTILYKSFERKRLAKRLYRSIRRYYPDIPIIIADDSREPLSFPGTRLTILHLPFNSGLSAGLQAALECVNTPYMIRLDDDMRLTVRSRFPEQFEFLNNHPEVDLVASLPLASPLCEPPKNTAYQFFLNSMSYAPRPLKIPHLTKLDEDHIVLGKTPNYFIARTEKMKSVGYDKKIRMIDHNDFFYRAAGNMVSVLDLRSILFHSHNHFDRKYQKYRSDIAGDVSYIQDRLQCDSRREKPLP